MSRFLEPIISARCATQTDGSVPATSASEKGAEIISMTREG